MRTWKPLPEAAEPLWKCARPSDKHIEDALLKLLRTRKPAATCCPSEVARTLISDMRWRSLMPVVRDVCVALSKAGYVEITQKGNVIAGTEVKGPIRIRLKRADLSGSGPKLH